MYTFVDPLYRAQKLFASEVAMVSEGGRLIEIGAAGIAPGTPR